MSLAVRGPLQSPMSQWALVAVGAMYVANPDKFFQILQRGAQWMLEAPGNHQHNSNRSSQLGLSPPIVIHSISGGGGGNRPFAFILQLSIGAGVCWGSYMVLVNVLPEAAKGMLPVTKGFFNTAVSSLGKGIINVRDSLMEQILGLGMKQDELSEKQDETHGEVLCVKDNVSDMRMDLGRVQQVLDECQTSLSEAEKRQAYIGQGVRLLTRGVNSLLPHDADLAYELDKYNRAGTELETPRPHPHHQQVQQAILSPPQIMVTPQQMNFTQNTPMVKADMITSENVHPVKKQDLEEIRALLHMVQYGTGQLVS
jgi:hypothetical protein